MLMPIYAKVDAHVRNSRSHSTDAYCFHTGATVVLALPLIDLPPEFSAALRSLRTWREEDRTDAADVAPRPSAEWYDNAHSRRLSRTKVSEYDNLAGVLYHQVPVTHHVKL